MNSFLRWVLLFSVITALSVVVHFYGGYNKIIEEDPSMICFGILAAFAVVTVNIGVLTWRFSRNLYNKSVINQVYTSLNNGWVSASIFSKLGMLGTIGGFIVAIKGFGLLDVSNPIQNAQAMKVIASGVSVALYTTLVGLICNVLITLQSYNLSQALKHHWRELNGK